MIGLVLLTMISFISGQLTSEKYLTGYAAGYTIGWTAGATAGNVDNTLETNYTVELLTSISQVGALGSIGEEEYDNGFFYGYNLGYTDGYIYGIRAFNGTPP